MPAHYFYFAAGLPDLFLDEKRHAPSFNDFMAEADDAVVSLDRDLLGKIRLQIDNSNVYNTLAATDVPFDDRGNLNREEVVAGCKGKELFPDYLSRFVNAYRDNAPPVAGYSWPDQLNALFFGEMMDAGNEFLREWFTFECNLRNVLAALTLRKKLTHLSLGSRADVMSSTIIGSNDVASSLRRSSAPDFGLSGKLRWIEQLLELHKKTPLEREKTLDILRWNVIDELVPVDFFRIETILACALKLLLVERWQKLDEQEGRRVHARLVEDCVGQFSLTAKG
ncbi:MAG: DUF2764 family protein [Chitinispirillaceae bacterium]|nr:DUF2764 family protein [Chitinispirillaceae bacterium]